MGLFDSPTQNPYQSPPPMSEPTATQVVWASDPAIPSQLRQFRGFMVAVGVLWIVAGSLGLLGACAAALLLWPREDVLGQRVQAVLTIVVAFGAVSLALGILACRKRIWAVYIGLPLSCVILLLELQGGKVIPVGLWGAAIVLAILAIVFSRKLKRAGVPLTTKPRELRPTMPAPWQSGGWRAPR